MTATTARPTTDSYDAEDPLSLGLYELAGSTDTGFEVNVGPRRYIAFDLGDSATERHLTIDQARAIGNALFKAADDLDSGRGTVE